MVTVTEVREQDGLCTVAGMSDIRIFKNKTLYSQSLDWEPMRQIKIGDKTEILYNLEKPTEYWFSIEQY